MEQASAKVTVECEYEVLCDLSYVVTSSDLVTGVRMSDPSF